MSNSYFDFKHFRIEQDKCAMKVGTDGVLLGAWADTPNASNARIFDIGTGTGIVALMMAQRFPTASLLAIDIDKPSVEQAIANVAASPFASRIEVCHAALQDLAVRESRFDAIVCNPPYFYDSLTCPDLGRTLARHALTLTARDIAKQAATMLTGKGELSVILPYDQRERMEAEASFAGLFIKRRCAVRTSNYKAPSRILLSFTNTPVSSIEQTKLTIGDAAYQTLTSPFYKDKPLKKH